MSDTKQPTQKEKRDENINKIFTESKELEILINQSIIDEDTKSKILLKLKQLKNLCKAQSDVIRLAYMIYFFKNLPKEKKDLYTRALVGKLKEIVNERAVSKG